MAHAQHHPQQITGWTGWIGLTSMIMAILAIFHVIIGIGGVFAQSWYVYAAGDAYLFDPTVWGWSMIVGGLLLGLTSALLLTGNMFGRVLGGIIVTLSLLANVALLPVAPVWSMIAIFLNVMVLYAIIAHGGEMKNFTE